MALCDWPIGNVSCIQVPLVYDKVQINIKFHNHVQVAPRSMNVVFPLAFGPGNSGKQNVIYSGVCLTVQPLITHFRGAEPIGDGLGRPQPAL